ncbi:MAG: hypothetical protein ACRDFS_11735 [Chloroflexota bacterium]
MSKPKFLEEDLPGGGHVKVPTQLGFRATSLINSAANPTRITGTDAKGNPVTATVFDIHMMAFEMVIQSLVDSRTSWTVRDEDGALRPRDRTTLEETPEIAGDLQWLGARLLESAMGNKQSAEGNSGASNEKARSEPPAKAKKSAS